MSSNKNAWSPYPTPQVPFNESVERRIAAVAELGDTLEPKAPKASAEPAYVYTPK